MRSLTLFNNTGGVGKTMLTFNLAHMLARMGTRTVVIDYDPQCNISSIFLDEDQLETQWKGAPKGHVTGCLHLVRRGKGELLRPALVAIGDAGNLWLLPGHLELSKFEQTLAEEWPKRNDSNNERALDVTTALDLLSDYAAEAVDAEIVLFDVGPSLGALNRSALLACDALIFPLAPDLFSLQGLKNVGPTLREWRADWGRTRADHLRERPQARLDAHGFRPVGYIVQQHLARADRPVTAYSRWIEQIPGTYHTEVLAERGAAPAEIGRDPHRIALIRHYASLVLFAQMARKPLFDLTRADGVSGGHVQAVAGCRKEFEELAREILTRVQRVERSSDGPPSDSEQ